MKSQIAIHWESAWAALRATPWMVFTIPFICAAAILLLRISPVGWATEKPVQELIAPSVLGMAALAVIFVQHWVRHKFTLMLAIFVWALFLRELHFEFMNGGILIALACLMWWLSMVRKEMTDWLANYWIRLWLSGSFFTYFISDMMDRHLFQFLPNYWDWNNNVEETLETCGHLMVFGLVLMTLKVSQHIAQSQSDNS